MKLLSISECQQWWKEKGPCLHPIFSLVQNYSRSTCRDVIGGCSRVDTLFSTAFCPKDWYGYQSNFLLEQTGCSYLNRKRLGFSKIPEGRPRKVLLSHVWLYRLRDVLMNHVMSCVCPAYDSEMSSSSSPAFGDSNSQRTLIWNILQKWTFWISTVSVLQRKMNLPSQERKALIATHRTSVPKQPAAS